MIKVSRLFGSFACFAGAVFVSQAQQITISGTVSDADGKGIAGAIVSLIEAKKSAITDAAGVYSISSGVTAIRREQNSMPPQGSPFLKGDDLYFSVAEITARVHLDLYTLLGAHVRTVLEKNFTRGEYQINLFAKDTPSQMYFLKVMIGDKSTVLALPMLAGVNHSQVLLKQADGAAQGRLAKMSAVADSILVGAVGYATLSQTIDSYSGTMNFTLQRTVPLGAVQVIQTTQTGDNLATKPVLTFIADDGSALPAVTVDSSQKYQSIIGFGGAFTEAAVYNLNKIGTAKANGILNAYFNPYTGSGYTVCRTPIHSCDFSIGQYTYDDTANDVTLKYFSIKHESQWKIPAIRMAMGVPGASIKIFGSPWSPLPWMKSNNNMENGGTLKTTCYDVWALYIVKFVQAMTDSGIPIWGLTMQNEPEAVQTWESCIYDPQQERDFLKNNLGPKLVQNNLDVKVMIWDHNKDHIVTWADTIFRDTTAEKYAWGTGFHWYTGDQFDNVAATHNSFPSKHLVATEQAGNPAPGYNNWTLAESYGHDIIGDLNSWGEGWVDWNLVLDQNGLPRHDPNTGCAASVITDFTDNSVHYNPMYYYIAHFSKFIRPGALRINCTNNVPNLETTSFMNTSGRIVVVALNRTANSISFKIKQGTQIIKPTIPGNAIMDFIL
jgi:glucosylceramidase